MHESMPRRVTIVLDDDLAKKTESCPIKEISSTNKQTGYQYWRYLYK